MTTKNTTDSAKRFECEVHCEPCGKIIEIGSGDAAHTAAYDAGRHAKTAVEHTRQGHSLRLVIKGVPHGQVTPTPRAACGGFIGDPLGFSQCINCGFNREAHNVG